MSEKYDDYLKTDYWKQVSLAVKKRADYRCQVCNSPHDLQAHHRTYDHRGQELNYLNDLVCLCRRCHGIFHGKIEHERARPPKLKGVDLSGMTKKERKKAINAMRMENATIDRSKVEHDMPPGDGPIELTDELVERCRTSAGGFTNASMIPLGVPKPLASGWAQKLVGKKISRAEYRQALEGRYILGIRTL